MSAIRMHFESAEVRIFFPLCQGWPAKAQGGRTQGVGIRFPPDEKSRQLKLKIEEILGTALGSDKPTQTI